MSSHSRKRMLVRCYLVVHKQLSISTDTLQIRTKLVWMSNQIWLDNAKRYQKTNVKNGKVPLDLSSSTTWSWSGLLKYWIGVLAEKRSSMVSGVNAKVIDGHHYKNQSPWYLPYKATIFVASKYLLNWNMSSHKKLVLRKSILPKIVNKDTIRHK